MITEALWVKGTHVVYKNQIECWAKLIYWFYRCLFLPNAIIGDFVKFLKFSFIRNTGIAWCCTQSQLSKVTLCLFSKDIYPSRFPVNASQPTRFLICLKFFFRASWLRVKPFQITLCTIIHGQISNWSCTIDCLRVFSDELDFIVVNELTWRWYLYSKG